MARVVLVHGIGQIGRPTDSMVTEWRTGIVDGLYAAGHGFLAAAVRAGEPAVSLAMARHPEQRPGRQGAGDNHLLDDEQLAAADEIAEEWLRNARESSDPAVARAGRLALIHLAQDPASQQGVRAGVGRAVALLDRIPYLTSSAIRAGGRLAPSVAEVTRYLWNEPTGDWNEPTGDYARARCAELIDADTVAVIGHSLGSVIAYEALRTSSFDVPLLITLGSPLGLKGINRQLRLVTRWPRGLRHWVNIADRDDIVAARPELPSEFGHGKPQSAVFHSRKSVDNGHQPHTATFYLAQRECGEALGDALAHALRE